MLADDVYPGFTPGFDQLSDVIGGWPGAVRRLVFRLGPLRALTLVWKGRSWDVIAVFRAGAGWRSLLLLQALLDRRHKLVVLHFIAHPPRARGLGAFADRVWAPLERWAIRRAVLRAQVLARGERELYAAAFGVEPERFCFIPFAWRMNDAPVPAPASERTLVVSAGRAMCDWRTLFDAAEGRSWQLTVVCGADDKELVERLNSVGHARVLSELSPSETTDLLLEAGICVLALADSAISHGQVRLCNAIDAGAAVVVSAVPALEGYIEPSVSALVVPPGDPAALSAAVDNLISDPGLRDRLAAAAFERAGAWTAADYVAAIQAFASSGTPPSLPEALERPTAGA